MASPLLNFALIGRKSSGKTCLLTALASPRLVNAQGINCDLSRSKDRYNEYLNQEIVKEFFKLSDSKDTATYEEMLATIDKQKNELTKNQLPNATSLSSKAAYIYNFDTKEKIHFDLGIFDYAGELVDAESTLSDNLKSVLGKMSALMILVDIGEGDKENLKKTSLEMSNLQQFFKSLESSGQGDARFNIPVALILTKIDKYLEIKNKTYLVDPTYPDNLLKQLESTEQYTNLSNLINSIESCTEPGMFKVFAASSFGELDENGNVDFPLKSFNILEPFKWAAEKWANNTVNKLLAELGSKGKIGMTLSCLTKDYNKELSVATSLLPKDSKLYSDSQELSKKISSSGATGLISLLAIILVAGLGLEFLFDYSHIFGLKNKELTLQNANKRIEWLEKYIDSSALRHSVAKLTSLSSTDAIQALKDANTQFDEVYWQDIINTTDMSDKIDKIKAYIAAFPKGIHISETQNALADSENIYAKEMWMNTLTAIESKLNDVKLGNLKLDKGTMESISSAIIKLKGLNKPEYGMDERLNNIDSTFETIASAELQKQIENDKGYIATKLNGTRYTDWIEALKHTWALKSKPGMKNEAWKDYASETVMQRFYDNYIKYIKEIVADEHKSFTELKSALELANVNDDRRKILDEIGWLEGEKEWFETHAKNIAINNIQKEYRELVAYSKTAKFDFKDFAQKKDKYLRISENIIKQLDEYNETKPFVKDLQSFQEFLGGIDKKPQKVFLQISGIKWNKEHTARAIVNVLTKLVSDKTDLTDAERTIEVKMNNKPLFGKKFLDCNELETTLIKEATSFQLEDLSTIVDIKPDIDDVEKIDFQITLDDGGVVMTSGEELTDQSRASSELLKEANSFKILVYHKDPDEEKLFGGVKPGEVHTGYVVINSKWINPAYELPSMDME